MRTKSYLWNGWQKQHLCSNTKILYFIHVPFKYESIDKFLTVATSPTLIVTGSSSYWKSVHVEGLNPGGSYSEGVTA